MEPTALELASNDELIEELLKRSTFRGLLLYQRSSYRGVDDQNWRWEARNCNPRMAWEGLWPYVEGFPPNPEDT